MRKNILGSVLSLMMLNGLLFTNCSPNEFKALNQFNDLSPANDSNLSSTDDAGENNESDMPNDPPPPPQSSSPAPSPSPSPSPQPQPSPPAMPSVVFPAQQILKSQPPFVSLPLPEYLVPVRDTSTGNYYTRITDQAALNDTRRVLRHHYAKDQPWNADGTLLFLTKSNPGLLLDGKTFKFLKKVSAPAHPLWSNVNPNVMYGLFGTKMVKFDIKTETSTTVRNFSEYTNIQFGPYEGNLSYDDKYICIAGYKSNGVDFLVYNIANNTVEGQLSIPSTADNVDWCSVSQSGNYVIVEMRTGTFAPDGKCGVKVYDRQMNFKRHLVSTCGGHVDMGYNTNGEEVLVGQDASSDATLYSYRLSDGVRRQELPYQMLAFNIHVSCRNLKRPGYCYVSTYAHTSGKDRYGYRENFAVKLDGSGKIERFAQSHFDERVSGNTAYDATSMAVPNRDGSLLLWASEWEQATNSVYAFIASVLKPF